jgi:hypothetical protein
VAGVHDFVIYQGADWGITLTWTAYGSLVDLTGWHAHLQVRPGFASQTPAVLINLTDPSGGITLGGTAGTISLALSAAQTAALSFASPAVYDLKMTNPSGSVTRLLQGAVTLSQQVTV